MKYYAHFYQCSYLRPVKRFFFSQSWCDSRGLCMGNERELKVIAFDLDYTLWPFRVDKESNPPFFLDNGKVKDTKGKEYTLYPEVHQVLGKLFLEGYTLGVASRIENIEAADQLMKYFNLKKYFSYIFVYPGTKINHFKDLQMHTGLEFKNMMFFDDDRRNIRDISRLGVMSVQVESGITLELLLKSIQEFGHNRQMCD